MSDHSMYSEQKPRTRRLLALLVRILQDTLSLQSPPGFLQSPCLYPTTVLVFAYLGGFTGTSGN